MRADALPRDPAAAARERWDLVVVGGGVYGCALLFEAARRGLRGVLVERADFGGGTSANHLRILHGGLRYLQHGDLGRHRESVRARAWFLRELPELVEPLACLMPLYGGVRRPLVFRAALALDRALGARDAEVLPRAEVLSAARVRALAPSVDARGLLGGALWHDARLPRPARLPLELLRGACARGAAALAYVEATTLALANGAVAGVRAVDSESGAEHELRAPLVVNAAGPAARALAARWDRDRPELFVPTRAWNVLFDLPAPAGLALALSPARRGASYFFVATETGRLLAGTRHAPAGATGAGSAPSERELCEFVAELASAAPGLGIARERVVRVLAGELPGVAPGRADLAHHAVLVDHGASGGPRGLWSVSGVKLTTAREVAARALARIAPGRAVEPGPAFDPATAGERGRRARPDEEALGALADEEGALHLDDLLLRRAGLGDDPAALRALAPRVAARRGWPPERAAAELSRLEAALAGAVQ